LWLSRGGGGRRAGGGGGRPPVVPVRDGNRPILWAAVAVDPRPRAPAVRERDDRAATLEIVPLLPIEHREKFGVVQLVDLPANTADAVDQAGVPAEVEQAPADVAGAEKRRSRAEHTVQRIAAHQGAIGEQEGRTVSRRPGASASGQAAAAPRGSGPSRSRGCRSRRSGRARCDRR